jgi:hypothetical protein
MAELSPRGEDLGDAPEVIAGTNLKNWGSTRSTLKLPREIEAITAEFLTQALQARFPGVTVRSFEIPFVHHGFTTIVRLHLDLDDAGKASGLPSSIIMKGGFEPQTRGIAGEWAIGPFLMEVGAYRTLPGLGLNMPDCYYAEVDIDHAEGPQIILLMEDLLERGVKFGHGLVPHTVEQVRARLTALAAFHARTWDSPELAEGGAYDIFPRNANVLFKSYMIHVAPPQTWAGMCAMPRGAACAVQYHDLDWALRAMDFMIELGDATPNVLVHGDLHAGNLFVEPDGTPGFYDSLPMRTAPMIEVSYHMVNVLDHAVRRRHERELVDHYRRELIRHGARPPSLDELMFQFAAFLPYGWATFMVNSDTYQTESFNTAHAARYNAAMLDHGTFEIINSGAIPDFRAAG